jgi:hypothetical protein
VIEQVGRRVVAQVRIQQEKQDAADLHFPELRVHDAVRILHVNDQPLAGSVEHRQNGHAMPVVGRVALALPAVGVERLPEVALGVPEPDPDEGKAEIAGCLQVISRQHAQATRVDGQALVDPVLHREVRDPRSGRGRERLREPPFALHVALEGLPGGVKMARERVVRRELVQPRLVDTPEELYRVAVNLFP